MSLELCYVSTAHFKTDHTRADVHLQRNPGTFITVLSGWSVFLSPMTGIVISDYFLVRRGEYHVGDMYLGNSRSAYWYNWGFNFRGFLAWIVGMAPLLRKKFFNPLLPDSWNRILMSPGTKLDLPELYKAFRTIMGGITFTKSRTSTASWHPCQLTPCFT